MLAGVFGLVNREPMPAVAEGLRAAGFEPVFQRASVWTEDQALPLDLAVTADLKAWGLRIARHYRGEGVPVLTVDLPPIRRPGLWALWPGEVNHVPADAPADRLHLVKLEQREPGQRVLVCGQKANDAAHGMSLQNLQRYFARTVKLLQAKHGRDRVVWRYHPQQPIAFDAVTSYPEAETIAEALNGDVGAVVTYNSTCGIEGLAAGLPVFSDPSSFYREVSSPGLPELGGKDRPAPPERVREFFSRLTHTVWTTDELATAEPWLETLERVN